MGPLAAHFHRDIVLTFPKKFLILSIPELFSCKL